MTSLLKLWAFIKHYWYIPIGFIIALCFFVITRDKKMFINWSDLLAKKNSSHKKVVEKIDAAHRAEIDANNRAVKRMEEVQRQIREEYDRNKRDLDVKTQKRINKIMKDLKDDPHALANAIEKETGLRVLVIE